MPWARNLDSIDLSIPSLVRQLTSARPRLLMEIDLALQVVSSASSILLLMEMELPILLPVQIEVELV